MNNIHQLDSNLSQDQKIIHSSDSSLICEECKINIETVPSHKQEERLFACIHGMFIPIFLVMNTTHNKHKTSKQNDTIGKKTLEGFAAAEKYNRWLTSRIIPFMNGKKILEIGCGLGNISKILAEQFNLTAIDIRKDYTDEVAKKLKITTDCVDLSQKTAYHDVFDGAVCLNVLEHIEEEQKALKNIYEALHPGGRFAVLVPAFNWLYGSIDEAIFHKRRYTRKRLRKALQTAGFDVKKTFYFNVFGIPGWFWQNRIRKRKELPDGQLSLFNKLVPALKIFDIPFRPFLGISVVAWAEKPNNKA